MIGYFLDGNAGGLQKVNALQSISFTQKRRITIKKTITELHEEGATTIKNERQILDHIEKYYSQLHTSVMNLEQQDFNNFFEPLTIPKLTTEHREKMEGPLSLEECRKALDTFESDKTPGEDVLIRLLSNYTEPSLT